MKKQIYNEANKTVNQDTFQIPLWKHQVHSGKIKLQMFCDDILSLGLCGRQSQAHEVRGRGRQGMTD